LQLLGDSCGLRVGELVSLTKEDVDLDEGFVTVRAGKGDKDRFVPMDGLAAGVLREYLASADLLDNRIFPLSPQRVWQMLDGLSDAAGIPHIHPHQLRHRFGTEMAKTGIEIRELADIMGHSSVDTTQGYIGLDMDFLRRSIAPPIPGRCGHDHQDGYRRLHRTPETGEQIASHCPLLRR
jgi:integrase/recombinase XerD